MIKRVLSLLLLTLFLIPCAQAKTLEEWHEGFESGEHWFGEDFAYDITDIDACWDLLMKPIVILDDKEKVPIYPRKTPDGSKVNSDKLGGFINAASAAVHVLGEDEDGWTLIEGMDYYDRKIIGYVRTKLLKTVTPNPNLGIIIDKLDQQLYMFVDGKLFSSCAVSTGLPNDKQPYNETATGEYLTTSWVGDFDSEGMICAKAIRFNGGDLLHQVPYTTNYDGSKNFKRFESVLGTKASHGCVRVQRLKSPEGLNNDWLWENLKRGTKVIVWDDGGRMLPYPSDDMALYYNPTGGKNYHAWETCSAVRDKYLPLKGFTYGELDSAPYDKLTPCHACLPVARKETIDADNVKRGAITQEHADELLATRTETALPAETPEETEGPLSTNPDNEPEVRITIH